VRGQLGGGGGGGGEGRGKPTNPHESGMDLF